MKLEFPPYETVVPIGVGTTVSPLRNYKGSPSDFLLTAIKQVGSVVRDSCGAELGRFISSYSFARIQIWSNYPLVEPIGH